VIVGCKLMSLLAHYVEEHRGMVRCWRSVKAMANLV